MTKEEFQNFLEEKVKAHWSSIQAPYLLTEIPVDFQKAYEIDYKDILKEQRLKAFVLETSRAEGYKVVQHPTQKSKIGLIPYNEEYQFPSSDDQPHNELRNERPLKGSKVKYATITFLEAISHLPEEDQDRINIPIKVIARLLSR